MLLLVLKTLYWEAHLESEQHFVWRGEDNMTCIYFRDIFKSLILLYIQLARKNLPILLKKQILQAVTVEWLLHLCVRVLRWYWCFCVNLCAVNPSSLFCDL